MTTAPSNQPDSFDFRRYEPGGAGGRGAGWKDRASAPRAPLGRLFDREPPASIEAEMSLLGSMILDPRVIADVINVVRGAESFYDERHGHIYTALVEVYDKHHSGDLVQLNQRLADRGVLEQVGGSEYLVRLAEGVPTAANAVHYARLVAEKHKLRRLIDAAGQILFDTYHGAQATGDDAGRLVDAAEQRIFEIAQEEMASDPQALSHLLQIEYERLMAIEEGQGAPEGVYTGFYDLDEMLSGFQPGEMIILAARPSMGKCLEAGEEIALADGRVMTIEEIAKARRGRVPTLDGRLRIGTAEPSDFIDDGEKPVFEVETRLGRRVRTTLTHPFLTLEGWRPLGELGVGTAVAVPRVMPVFGAGEMRACEVKLLAYLIGDGGLTGSTPRFTNGNPRIERDFRRAVGEFGDTVTRGGDWREGAAPSWRLSRDAEATASHRSEFGSRLGTALRARGWTKRRLAARVGVSAASVTHWTNGSTVPDTETMKRVCEVLEVGVADLSPGGASAGRMNDLSPVAAWLDGLGLLGAGSHAKSVPAPVFEVRREMLALFVNRLFATDGWATVLSSGQCQVGYATVSERLARQVQHLLLRFGVVAKLRQRFVKYREARRCSWQLEVTDAASILRFTEEIGIYGKEGAVRRVRKALQARRARTNVDVVPMGVWSRIDAARGGVSWDREPDHKSTGRLL
ncbi:MAG: helix-turn-helix domain-containing protein [Phycisphaerae bacterium]|nr:helix-turn-helix domain-containing protein [Phycisphaerae bacterium]